MIDMRERQQRMQWRIDAGSAAIKVEGAVRQIADHFVVIRWPGIVRFQPEQLVLIKCGKAIELH